MAEGELLLADLAFTNQAFFLQIRANTDAK